MAYISKKALYTIGNVGDIREGGEQVGGIHTHDCGWTSTRSDWKIERAVGAGRDCKSPTLKVSLVGDSVEKEKSVTDLQQRSEQTNGMRMDSLSAVVVENLLCDRSGNARRNGKRKIKASEFGLLRVDFF